MSVECLFSITPAVRRRRRLNVGRVLVRDNLLASYTKRVHTSLYGLSGGSLMTSTRPRSELGLP